MDIKLLATQLELFHAIFDKSCDAIVVVDAEAKVRYWSESAVNMFGMTANDVIGQSAIEALIPKEDREFAKTAFASYQSTGESEFIGQIHEVQALGKPADTSGQTETAQFWVDLSLTDIRVEDQRWLMAIIRDARSRRERESQLQHQATTDSLSGLPNRSAFQAHLEDSLAVDTRTGKQIALAILDVDEFKQVNDTHGHPVGDEAICHVGDLLAQKFESALCFARLGGDEFGVLLESDSDEIATALFEEFLRELENSSFSESRLRITASIGIGFAGNDSTPRSLLTIADKALYQSKSGGRNRVTILHDTTCED